MAALVVVIVIMVMMVMMLVLVVLVIVVMVMAALMVVVIMIVMMVVMMLVLVIVIIVVMMMVAAAALIVIIVVMVMLVRLVLKMLQLGGEGVLPLHGLEDLRAGDLIPRGGDDRGGGVLLAQHGDAAVQLLLAQPVGAGEDDGARVLDLIVEELAEVLHVDAALVRVDDGGEAVELEFIGLDTLHGADDVGQLADAGGLDEDAVGAELLEHLLEGLLKVADEAAADAAGIHLVDRDARVLQETAVDGDLAELVFDEDDLLAGIRLGDELLDQRRFPRAEKAGENVNFGHGTIHFLSGFGAATHTDPVLDGNVIPK